MDLHIEYICALTNLYGHVLPEKVCEIHNQQNHKQLDPVEIGVYLTNPGQKMENRYIYIKEGEFIEEAFYLFEQKYKELVAKQAGKPHYVPVKEELLKYAKLHYWEKPAEYNELETYIFTNYFPDNEQMMEQLAEEIFYHIQHDKVDTALEIFSHYEINFKDETESDPVLYIMQRLSNNTRMKAHNGHTPLELSKITGEPIYTLPNQLPGEEDECHCGSKKQYKTCHMEDDNKIKRLSDYRVTEWILGGRDRDADSERDVKVCEQ